MEVNINLHILRKGMMKTTLFAILLLYLAIPFKQQFLSGVHLLSHVASYEKSHHSHDHHEPESNHHHNFLEFLNQALDGHHSNHPIPVVLTNFQFQTHLQTQGLHIIEYFPSLINKVFRSTDIHVLINPFFEVPTPPP